MSTVTKVLNLGILMTTLGVASMAHADTWYVNALTGSDGYSAADARNNSSKPLKTINKAIAYANTYTGWNDVVSVRAGTYNEEVAINKSGLTVTNYGTERPKILTPTWAGQGVKISGNNNSVVSYITFKGFEVTAPAGTSTGGIGMMNGAHHITIRNNIVHDVGSGGIETHNANTPSQGEGAPGGCDYITIEDNTVYNTCFWSKWDNSAISLYGLSKLDNNSGWHCIVRRNRIYGNIAKYTPPSEFGNNYHTDGNGIIMDLCGTSGPLTLIENNLVYKNGGRGIHIFKSGNAYVLNNSTYKNCQDPDIKDGELTAIVANDVLFCNNLAYGKGGLPVYKSTAYSPYQNVNVTFKYNSYFNGTTPTLQNNDTYGDPRYVDPENGNLRCNTGGIGINTGTTSNYAWGDFSGVQRPQGSGIDRGAYERS